VWGTVLFFGVVSSIEAQRIGIAAILVGLPRPMRNLFAFWVGLMISGSVLALAGALLLRDSLTPVIGFLTNAGSILAAPPVKIVLGLLAMSIAATLVTRSPARQVVPVQVGGLVDVEPADFEPAARTPNLFSRVSGLALGRFSWSTVLEKGSTKLAFVAGLSTSSPPVEFWGAVLAVLASQAAVGAQVAAFLMFMLASYAVAEIPLVCHLLWPAKTRAVLMQLQGWLRAHQRGIFVFIFGAFGLLTVIGGVSAL
jgi:Sap, sulfolipid-1-addressing protein